MQFGIFFEMSTPRPFAGDTEKKVYDNALEQARLADELGFDCVSGVGYDRAAAAGAGAERYHEIRRVISNLGVFDFETPDHRMRVRSLHPGVTIDQVVAATGFELTIPDQVPESPIPTADDLAIIAQFDPTGLRNQEVKSPG